MGAGRIQIRRTQVFCLNLIIKPAKVICNVSFFYIPHTRLLSLDEPVPSRVAGLGMTNIGSCGYLKLVQYQIKLSVQTLVTLTP